MEAFDQRVVGELKSDLEQCRSFAQATLLHKG